MGHKDTDSGGHGLSRRDFLKATAASVAAGGAAEFAFNTSTAMAYEDASGNPLPGVAAIKTTTCPYCSASCGQRVAVDASGNVLDVYGDYQSPFNSGGLCAKGAGTLQLVNNIRRVGAFTFPTTFVGTTYAAHPEDAVFAADGTSNAVAYKRTGNGPWSAVTMASALTQIAAGDASGNAGLVGYRGSFLDASGNPREASGYNSQSVAFLGCSHMNNEENYLYRRLIAMFGTTNTEHQARI